MTTIRKAELKDAKDLEDINHLAKNETGWWIPQNENFYERFLRTRNNEIQIAYDGTKIVGFVSIEYNPQRKSIWINDIYVNSEYREKGIAKQLIEEVLKNWKEKSKSIALFTADRNLSIFEKLGFKKTMNFMELQKPK